MAIDRLTEIMEEGQESFTGYQASITSDHAYIHQGKAFTSLINTGSISAAYHIAFTTPSVASGKYIHWRPIGISTSSNYVSVTMKEESSYTFAGGSTVAPVNRNRNSSATTTMQAFYTGVTNAGTGTTIDIGALGVAGNAATRSGGSGGENEELLLVPNTDYVITLTPAGATTVLLRLFWYEED